MGFFYRKFIVKFILKFNISFTEFQYIAQHDYQELLVITHVNISNETFHSLEIANEAYRLSFANQQNCTILKLAIG